MKTKKYFLMFVRVAICSAAILRPFLVTKTCGLYDAYIDCVGGGTSGKASAMRLAIARALVQANPATATVLQKGDDLTNDLCVINRFVHFFRIVYQSYCYMKTSGNGGRKYPADAVREEAFHSVSGKRMCSSYLRVFTNVTSFSI